MKLEKLSINKLIKNVLNEPIKNNYFLYTKNDLINENDDVLLVEDNDYDAPENIDGYEIGLSWKEIRGIIDNLNAQKPNDNEEGYIRAINFYIENDAFIDLEEEK